LPVDNRTLVLIENVGNLVCPSMFDVGENLRIVCLSVTEGTDKPEKYPVSFREADVAVIAKSDLSPYVEFDLARCCRLIDDIHPNMPVFVTSAKHREGLAQLRDHLLGLWKA
jgi:hydrogenase nickel incorporation protein HypB